MGRRTWATTHPVRRGCPCTNDTPTTSRSQVQHEGRTVFAPRMTGVSFDATRFDSAADAYDDDPHHLLIAQQLVAGLRPTPTAELVVDVATGTGFAALSALEALAPRRVVAVDVSPRMIEKASAKNGRIEWRVAPAVPLDLPDGVADVVL